MNKEIVKKEERIIKGIKERGIKAREYKKEGNGIILIDYNRTDYLIIIEEDTETEEKKREKEEKKEIKGIIKYIKKKDKEIRKELAKAGKEEILKRARLGIREKSKEPTSDEVKEEYLDVEIYVEIANPEKYCYTRITEEEIREKGITREELLERAGENSKKNIKWKRLIEEEGQEGDSELIKFHRNNEMATQQIRVLGEEETKGGMILYYPEIIDEIRKKEYKKGSNIILIPKSVNEVIIYPSHVENEYTGQIGGKISPVIKNPYKRYDEIIEEVNERNGCNIKEECLPNHLYYYDRATKKISCETGEAHNE